MYLKYVQGVLHDLDVLGVSFSWCDIIFVQLLLLLVLVLLFLPPPPPPPSLSRKELGGFCHQHQRMDTFMNCPQPPGGEPVF